MGNCPSRLTVHKEVTVCVRQLSGQEIQVNVKDDEPVELLKRKIATRLGIDFERRLLELACGDEKIEDVKTCIRDLPHLMLNLVLTRLVLVEQLEPELPQGGHKYWAGGVGGQNGCIYFAPCNAGRVLRVDAEGNVEQLEPELPQGGSKYCAGGAVGQDGCIYFAPCNAGKVLRVNACLLYTSPSPRDRTRSRMPSSA